MQIKEVYEVDGKIYHSHRVAMKHFEPDSVMKARYVLVADVKTKYGELSEVQFLLSEVYTNMHGEIKQTVTLDETNGS